MANIQLLVTPETLRLASGECSDLLRNIRSHAARIGDISERTRAYWQGDAGMRDREGYTACRDDLLEAADALESRVQSLLRLAGVYQKMEEEAEEMSAALRTDTLSQELLL